jgi:hypothetical protein
MLTDKEVKLGHSTVFLPRGALYFPKLADEPSVDMIIYQGRIIIGGNQDEAKGPEFCVWLGAMRAFMTNSYERVVQWCQENPVTA